MTHPASRHTVVIGCSFGGLECVHRLARLSSRRDRITVIEANGTHAYVPLLHEVVSGAMPVRAISFDRATHCRTLGASFIEATALGIDATRQWVTTDRAGTIAFDRLVVATGAAPALPQGGRNGAVIPVRSLDDALALLRRVRAVRAVAPAAARPTRAVVVGGGISGVEWAAELAHAGIDGEPLHVTLVAKSSRLVPELCGGAADWAARRLESIGVEVVLGQRATLSPDPAGPRVVVADGRSWGCDAVVWAAGITPSDSVRRYGLPRTASGALAVDSRLRVPGAPHIHAIGDAIELAAVPGAAPPARRAIEAMRQAKYVARALTRGSDNPYVPLGTFPYGLSVGGGASAIVFGGAWFVASPNAWFRRALCRAYHDRYRVAALPAAWRRRASEWGERYRVIRSGEGTAHREEVHQ